MTENQPEHQTNNSPEDPSKEIDALLADLWQRHLPTLRERLILLDRVAAEAATGILDETSRAEGQSVAHKLSGNLGMFGHQKAGDISSQIEHLLKAPTPETLARLSALARELRRTLASSL